MTFWPSTSVVELEVHRSDGARRASKIRQRLEAGSAAAHAPADGSVLRAGRAFVRKKDELRTCALSAVGSGRDLTVCEQCCSGSPSVAQCPYIAPIARGYLRNEAPVSPPSFTLSRPELCAPGLAEVDAAGARARAVRGVASLISYNVLTVHTPVALFFSFPRFLIKAVRFI